MVWKFLVPQDGLLVRDPINMSILSEGGEYKPWFGAEGKYWRRRVKDGSVTISEKAKEQKTEKTKEPKQDHIKEYVGGNTNGD